MSPKTRPVLTTAWIFDDGRIVKAATASTQLPEDPFTYGEGQAGLKTPPYSLEQLAGMLETNTLHYRAVKQKASDVAGRGFTLRATDDGTLSDQAQAAWAAFVASVEDDERADESFKERIVAAHEDFESTGWAVLEVSRRGDGLPDGLWQVPAQTVRAHHNGRTFAQIRNGKLVWFKRFGLDGDVDRKGGGWSATPIAPEIRGNEVIVIRNYTPRSSFYGLPDHIPALAALAGWRAQAEFNVRFFDNNAVPAYAVVIEGADLTTDLEEKIRDHFKLLKGDPHRTLIIPVPGSAADEAAAPKVRFERLSFEIKDASFRLYRQDAALEICIAHGIPPYRIGWPIVGSLGGSTAEEMTQIYNDSIVQPRQETWEQRLTRALLGPKGLAVSGVTLKAAELDTRNETRDIAKARALWEMDTITINGVASFFGLPTRALPEGDFYRDQIEPTPAPISSFGGLGPIDATMMAKRWGTEVTEFTRVRKQLERLVDLQGAAA